MSIWQSTGEFRVPNRGNAWLSEISPRQVKISHGHGWLSKLIMEHAEPCNITPLGDDGYPLDWPADEPRWQRGTR